MTIVKNVKLIIIFLIALFYLPSGLVAEKIEFNYLPDSLKNEIDLRRASYEPEKFTWYINDTLYFDFSQNNTQLAIEIMQYGYRIALQTDNRELMATSTGRIAKIYGNMGEGPIAIDYYRKSLVMFNDLKDSSGYAWTLLNIGNIFYAEGLFNDALNYYQNALNNFAVKETEIAFAVAYNNLALCYSYLNKVDSSLHYFALSYQLSLQKQRFASMGFTLSYIGLLYAGEENRDSSIYYFEKSIDLLKSNWGKTTDERDYEILYSKILKKYIQALTVFDMFDRGIEISELTIDFINNHNLEVENVFAYYEYANLRMKMKDFAKAKQLALKSYLLAKKLGIVSSQADQLKILADITEKLGQIDESHSYLRKYIEFRDSLSYHSFTHALKNIHSEVENDKVEKIISNLNLSKELQELQLKQRGMLIWFFAASALFLTLIALVLFNRFTLKRKAEKELKMLNEELREINDKLVVSEKNLQELNETKDKFFSIIAHDLKNPLAIMMNSTELLSNPIYNTDMPREELDDFLHDIHKASKNLYYLLENLLTWARSQRGVISFTPEFYNMIEIVNIVLDALQQHLEKKKIKLKIEVPSDLQIYCDKMMLTTILRNLMSNAIKFSPEGQLIQISANEKDGSTVINIVDNGLGIPVKRLNNLFKIDSSFSTPDTNGNVGTGLGLIISNEFANQHKGKIKVESTEGKGSKFTVLIPKQPQ